MRRSGLFLLIAILVWAVASAAQDIEPIRILSGHIGRVECVAFSPDGRTLASGSDDKTLKLWDVQSGNLLRTFHFGEGLFSRGGYCDISSVLFSPNGRKIAVGGTWEDLETVQVWDTGTGNRLVTLQGSSMRIYGLAFSPDGRILASSSGDGIIRLWDTATWATPQKLSGSGAHYSRAIYTIEFTPDNKHLIAGISDGTVRTWDTESVFSEVKTVTAYEYDDSVWLLAVSPDGLLLATLSYKNVLKIWEMTTGDLLRSFRAGGNQHCLSFSPNGKFLFKGFSVWNVETGERTFALASPHVYWNDPSAFSPDGHYLASGSKDGAILLWDVDAILHPNELPIAAFTWQTLSVSGTRLVVEPRTGDSIQFDASSSSDPDGVIVSYAWDWDSNGSYNGTTADPLIEHTFSAAGSHRVTLRVTDDGGATETITKTVAIGEKQSPHASFTFSPSSPSTLDTVQFTDSTSDPDGQVVEWKWNFGDGSISTAPNPTHQYTEKKTFTVTLDVIDNDGLTDTKTASITVTNISPTASFTFFPERPYINQPVSFDASTSTDKDGTITGYVWDFNGDGKEDVEGEKVSWTFTEIGTFTVTLTVTDDDGDNAFHQEEITVKVWSAPLKLDTLEPKLIHAMEPT